MYTIEQKRRAIEQFVKFDHSYADTVAELGYPNKVTLRLWWKKYQEVGDKMFDDCTPRSKFTPEMKQDAVDYYLEHGKSLARTMRAMGYPSSREYLCAWIDELAPGERKYRGPSRKSSPPTVEEKVRVVAALEGRSGTAQEAARANGVARCTAYHWRKELLETDNVPDSRAYVKGEPVGTRYDDLPDDIEELKEMAENLQQKVRRLELELDVRQATLEIVKKDPGADPNRLTNREKAQLIDSLRGKWRLRELLEATGMAKSSYEYATAVLNRPESEERRAARENIAAAFEESGGTYGYRRICAIVGLAEWTVRKVMAEQGLAAVCCKKKRKYSSYAGEVSEAPANTCLKADGTHDFSALAPNSLWLTDITEFRIKAGKIYLSPILDCFDGMPISWSISTSPNAELANTSLEMACAQLADGEHPRIHNDRGGHYRWPGWIAICEEHGLIRSMSRKGHSPDNSRMEGFFGRLKIEFFYGRDWDGVSIEEFMDMLDAYLMWYRDVRLKSDLGYVSPKRYREERGLAA